MICHQKLYAHDFNYSYVYTHTHTHIYIHIYTCEHIYKITKPCEKNFARELEKIYQEMYDIYC